MDPGCPPWLGFSFPSSAPLFLLLAAPPRLEFIRLNEEQRSFRAALIFVHDSPRRHNGVGTLAVGVAFLSSVTQSRQTKLAIAAEPLEKHYS